MVFQNPEKKFLHWGKSWSGNINSIGCCSGRWFLSFTVGTKKHKSQEIISCRKRLTHVESIWVYLWGLFEVCSVTELESTSSPLVHIQWAEAVVSHDTHTHTHTENTHTVQTFSVRIIAFSVSPLLELMWRALLSLWLSLMQQTIVSGADCNWDCSYCVRLAFNHAEVLRLSQIQERNVPLRLR